ncbi:hypothetical protein FYK55_15375 [Roseiconus nitratireducens]|uniref:Secreted protein n=1 Tax=Roseiconus nitratireducens TaxID=2605748 RepID=A0A5M6D3X0_9BACT|nr:hypothetical protein [Roseiconus nitratireducens]KAA5542184.1 hypothetical protein FYK55_15375 [Roseiconus nitratireducens]
MAFNQNRWHLLSALLIGGLMLVPGARATAQFTPAERESLSEAARRSADQLQADRIDDVDASKQAFLQAVENLRDYLGRSTDPENAEAWLQYLKIPPVLEAIDSDADESSLVGDVIEVEQKATALHPGLELDAVRRLRSAAQRYGNSLRFRRKDRTIEALSKQLDAFADKWQATDAVPDPDDLTTLRLLLDLLERMNQDVALRDEARQLFGKSNMQLTVDGSMVQRLINRPVHQPSPVRDCILGTTIVGDALLTGNVTATLLPSIGSVRLQLNLDGTVNTNNIGYNGPVRLRTTGVGQVQASRVLSVDEAGIALEPVQSSAALATRIHAIEHPLRLVRKIAWKRAAQQKPQADAIAQRHMADRVAKSFAQQTASTAARPAPDFLSGVTPLLRRLDIQEPPRTIGSTSHTVFFNTTIGDSDQLAAPLAAPPITKQHDLTLQIHESVINNTLGTILAGRTMTRSQLAAMMRRARGDDGAGSGDDSEASTEEDAEDEEEFEIDFDRSRPVVFEAREGTLRIGIRGTRFAQGRRSLQRPLEVVATYRPIRDDTGRVQLERVGEAEINFPGTKRLSVAQAGLRGSIQKGFAKAFPDVLMNKAWVVPQTVSMPALRGREFVPRLFETQEGWLTLGVDQTQTPVAIAGTTLVADPCRIN